MAETQNPLTVKRECDRFRPIYYAAASGDFNPIHIDKEMAQMAGLPGNILHGMCTMAWAVEAAIDALGGDPGSLRRIKVRFSKPVKIDDVITLTAKREGTTVELSAVNQAGEEVLKNAVAEGR
ncbi:MAG: MaoC/PaaZ C-terminal domain-containing protein [Myxococcales bacterium]